ncbi:syntaxin 8 [Geosmithia morbida]|uniref:Syntaxin 8 n=1 Tax=Geosmithia morbida TaxID=1094350 RepID=A0A9P4Z1Z0_9HYPO|nr:syntaxin 8 [Geosmithia morbida]KAF4125947.1 syntaxin 8 [Geosmithia morbida]
MANPNQLYLLADHIKLSLLERQRVQKLAVEDGPQDAHILRSLDQFRDGLESLEEEMTRLEREGDAAAASDIADSIPSLRKQFDHLTSQFHGFTDRSVMATVAAPNSDSLASIFTHAASSEVPKTKKNSVGDGGSKSVRFSDAPSSPSQDLFGAYRDNPASDSMGYQDAAGTMDNQQLHQYHSQILDDQDEQLDRLGESIGRQRELSMQIGNELEDHIAMLDEVESATDRHQNRIDRAGRALGKVARSANDNKQITAIVVLIIILVLLIAILK